MGEGFYGPLLWSDSFAFSYAFVAKFFLQYPGEITLCLVGKWPVPPSTKTFFFEIHTNMLPVKTWLHIKGIFVLWSLNCRLRNQPETIERCFIPCNDGFFSFAGCPPANPSKMFLYSPLFRTLPFSSSWRNYALPSFTYNWFAQSMEVPHDWPNRQSPENNEVVIHRDCRAYKEHLWLPVPMPWLVMYGNVGLSPSFSFVLFLESVYFCSRRLFTSRVIFVCCALDETGTGVSVFPFLFPLR